MDQSPIDALLTKAKSSDTDTRVDAIAKLQLQFESAVLEDLDFDSITAVLKSCLRISNQHLSSATLSAIQAYIPLITRPNSLSSSTSGNAAPPDPHAAHNLRQALLAFLPSGGVIDRLGEAREVTRTVARDTIVILGAAALQLSGPNPTGSSGSFRGKESLRNQPELPFAPFEKFIKELGTGSKVWRVREQTILALAQLRRENPRFPVRPFLSPLVDALEDPDGSVRDCARQSVVTMFSGPGVSDAARSDLKNEMTKKKVRKAIVDGVLAKLMGTGAESSQGDYSGSESDVSKSRPLPTSVASTRKVSRELPRGNGQSSLQAMGSELPSESTPSAAGAPAIVKPVFIASARDLEQEFARMMPHFEGKETEHNWAVREQAVLQIRGMLKGEAHRRYPDVFVEGLKSGVLSGTLKPLASLRTTVSANTCLLYSDLAVALGHLLDPFVEMLLTSLLRMAGFTKKIAAQQSQASVTSILTHTSCQPRITINLLFTSMQEKTVQARQFVIGHVSLWLELHANRNRGAIEASGALDHLDKILRKGLTDPNPVVKEKSRLSFWIFERLWPTNAAAIMDGLDSVARKQLEKAGPGAPPGASTSTEIKAPVAKKSSVAAAIAASRAKAKAIATAPPTLRHAATSGASAAAAAAKSASPPARSVSSTLGRTGARTVSSSGMSRRSSSSTNSPPQPAASKSMSRSVSSISPQSNVNSRARSNSPSPPPSPTVDLALRRRAGSPLGNSTSHRSSSSPSHLRPISPPNFTSSHSHPANTPTSNGTARAPLPSKSLPRHLANVPRDSIDIFNDSAVDDNLLNALQNPLPPDSDDEGLEDKMKFLNFSSSFEKEKYPPPPHSASSAKLQPGDSISNQSSQTLSPKYAPSEEMVEDDLRAAAAQAVSSAERLDELMEPDNLPNIPSMPSSLVVGGTPKSTVKGFPLTPANRYKGGLKGLSLFKDSPAIKGSPSVMDHLYEKKHQTGWWLKRKSLLDSGTPLKADPASQVQELGAHVKALVEGTATIRTLQKVVLLCASHPATEADVLPSASEGYLNGGGSGLISPSPSRSNTTGALGHDIWEGGRMFDALLTSLDQFLRTVKDDEVMEYGLCVLWEMVENQTVYLNEAQVFSLLFNIRYSNTQSILEATSTIRDALISRQEPVYGLQTIHACLREFLSHDVTHGSTNDHIRTSSHAFGIIGIGKFIMRLPAEILEDELPRLKYTLISVLDEKDPSRTTVRESAYASIVAANAILRDERRLFSLLDGLAESKKNLLTYYFDKHGARGAVEGVDKSRGAVNDEKVVKELLRLDVKISTPVKPTGEQGV